MAFQSFAAVNAETVAIAHKPSLRHLAVRTGGVCDTSFTLDHLAALGACRLAVPRRGASLTLLSLVLSMRWHRGPRDLATRGVDGARPVDGLRRGKPRRSRPASRNLGGGRRP